MCYKAKIYKNAHFLAPNPCLEILVMKLVKKECCSVLPAVLLCSEDERRDENKNSSVASCCSLIVSSAATNPVEHWVCHSEQPQKQAQVSGTRSRHAAPAAAPAHRSKLGPSLDH